MPNLYTIATKNKPSEDFLDDKEKLSVYYHNLFDYPLSFADLVKWTAHGVWSNPTRQEVVVCKDGYYFLEGKEGLVYKRMLRNRISGKKLDIARKASRILSLIPTIKMVAVTGSLAMGNATDEGDIDLLIITQKGSLWTTRLVSYLIVWLFGLKVRKPDGEDKKDKLCLNMWMDEDDTAWEEPRNLYTAHEIAQTLPLVDKDNTYQKFLWENRWILDYWPNAVRINKGGKTRTGGVTWFNLAERLAYFLQYQRMKSKITREVVTPTRAIFHPQDWGTYVLSRLGS